MLKQEDNAVDTYMDNAEDVVEVYTENAEVESSSSNYKQAVSQPVITVIVVMYSVMVGSVVIENVLVENRFQTPLSLIRNRNMMENRFRSPLSLTSGMLVENRFQTHLSLIRNMMENMFQSPLSLTGSYNVKEDTDGLSDRMMEEVLAGLVVKPDGLSSYQVEDKLPSVVLGLKARQYYEVAELEMYKYYKVTVQEQFYKVAEQKVIKKEQTEQVEILADVVKPSIFQLPSSRCIGCCVIPILSICKLCLNPALSSRVCECVQQISCTPAKPALSSPAVAASVADREPGRQDIDVARRLGHTAIWVRAWTFK